MKYIFLLIFVFLFSCTRQKENENELLLFNQINFFLLENEKSIDLEKDITKNYLEYTSKYPFSIPLFKCIESENYIIFLGVPYKISSQEFIEYKKSISQKTNTIKTKSDANFYFEYYEQNQNHVSECLIDIEGNRIYIIAVSKSEKIASSLFTYAELSKRLITNKN